MTDNPATDENINTATDINHEPSVDNGTPNTDERPNDDERGAANREAAKYRRQLRDVEAQRDQLGERLAAMQQSQAETLAREHLADGADIWRDGLELSAVLDNDGNLDPAKVAAAAKATRTAHPHWAAPQPHKVIKRNQFASGATGRQLHDPAPTSWQKVLNTRLGDD